MNLVINVLIVLMALWLIAVTAALAFMYDRYVRGQYSKAAKDYTEKPDKSYIVPSGGFFSVKKKRAAIVNDDRKAWQEEKREDDRLRS